jgi:catechol 2,3-dioxygenase-like lactoylglutathione lyase family enzyme
MAIAGLNHFTVLTDDVPRTVRFYREALGLVEGPRPPFDFPGAWLYAGPQAVLHVVGGRPSAELRAGVIDHVAFSVTDLARTLGRLDALGIVADCRRLPGGGDWQVFCHDPNGARVELDFPATEAGPGR